jgi:hypothetical protein
VQEVAWVHRAPFEAGPIGIRGRWILASDPVGVTRSTIPPSHTDRHRPGYRLFLPYLLVNNTDMEQAIQELEAKFRNDQPDVAAGEGSDDRGRLARVC